MRQLIGILFLSFFLHSCIQHANQNQTEGTESTLKPKIEVKYAKGFSIDQSHEYYALLKTNSLSSTYAFEDSIAIGDSIPKQIKALHHFPKRLAIQSSTYLAYLKALNQLDLVKGVSGKKYMTASWLKEYLKSDSWIELNNENEINTESLVSINPDLFLIFPFELKEKDRFEHLGVQTLIISEYLEETPLARAEWIKCFGLLTGESQKAKEVFNVIDSTYQTLVENEVDTTKKVMFNLPFQDQWAMPASNSITANLAKDAGFKYIYSDSTLDNSIRPKEPSLE